MTEKPQPMRIVFMGSPEFAVPSLKALVNAGHEVVGVYCQPPKPANRGKKITPCPVQAYAEEHDLPVFTPQRMDREEVAEELESLKPDVAVVVAFGHILKPHVLDIPKHGCINLHPSLLPKYRGPSPIQYAIKSGDTETGVCIIQMNEGCDTGDILLSRKVPLTPNHTTPQLQDELSQLGAELIIYTLAGMQLDLLNPIKQSDDNASYAPKLERETGKIIWKRPADEIERLARALQPWPCAFFSYKGEAIKILEATIIDNGFVGEPGMVVIDPDVTDGRVCICTGNAMLQPEVLQRPNRRVMNADEFFNGFTIPEDTVLKS
jgi:methionyl-tRNA formyltransferase